MYEVIASNILFASGVQPGTPPPDSNQESVRDIVSKTDVGAPAELDRVLEKRDGFFPEADDTPSRGARKTQVRSPRRTPAPRRISTGLTLPVSSVAAS